MGTNYYLYEQPPCPTCARPFERKHIGKSSAGWVFALHIEPEDGIRDLPDWEDRWSKPGAVIENEYDEVVTVEDMRLIIMARARPADKPLPAAFYHENGAEPGPAGLARSKIGRHCYGHGMGTWDLHVGEFS